MDLQNLVKSAQQRNHEAMEVLLKNFYNMAIGYAFSLLGDFETAEDVVQESAIDVYCNIHKLRIPQAFPSWFKKIIYRNSIIHKRHPPLKWVQLENMDQINGNDILPDVEFEQKDLRKIVRQYIDNLSQSNREVAILFYLKGYHIHEIAAFLDIPMNTVKTRLFHARKNLKERMESTMTEYLNNNISKQFSYRNIIEGVPSLFHENDTRQFFEDVSLCSCIRTTLDTIGNNWGSNYEIINGKKWFYSRLYAYLMGITGLAFRFTWRKKWDISIVSSYLIGHKVDTVFTRAYDAIGYTYSILRTKYSAKEKKLSGKDKKDLFIQAKKIIIKNIDNGVPVIAHGVIGPPEECLITGYDKNGDVVTGWNIFQKKDCMAPEWYGDTDNDGIMEINMDREVDYEPSGYFRKHNWFNDTWSVMHITGKKDIPDRKDIYLDSLKWALDVIRKKNLYIREYENGISAYIAFADSVKRLKTETENSDEIRSKYMIFISAVAMIIDNRTWARLFLKEISSEFQEISNPLSAVSEIYLNELKNAWEIWKLLEIRNENFKAWPSVVRDHNTKRSIELFADKKIRLQCSDTIRSLKEYEIKAADYIEEAIRIWSS